MPSCLIGLGSNLGDRAALLQSAVDALRVTRGVDVRAVSSWHATLPIGGPAGQGEFLNGAVLLDTPLPPRLLLNTLRSIERQLGRDSRVRWEARPIDLDLLLYGDLVLDEETLTVPHPWMAIRRFVLEPAVEVAADMIHPIIGWTVNEILAHISLAPPYFAVAGVPGVGKTFLVESVLRRVSGRLIRSPDPADVSGTQCRDSSGRTWEGEIEFLRERTRLLDQSAWPRVAEPAFSDFWLRQSQAYGRITLPETRWEALDQAVQEACEIAVPPKLLFLLCLSPEVARPSVVPPRDLSAKELWRLQSELICNALRPGQGPVLRVDAHDRPRAISDVIAAIQAMNG
jgi:2-amino-4-hydroxy-6-hydroxymethyldihydropteridine diphosphokinase